MTAGTISIKSPAQELIEFVHALSPKSVPESAVRHAKWCLLDSIGCALFGSQQVWSKIMAEEMFTEASKGRCSVCGYKGTLAAPAAALCNGTFTHGFELDDLLDEPIVHPGAIIVPAAIAAAESVDTQGERVLLGVIAGYEAMNRVGLAVGLEPAHRGFHKTAVVGPVGAAIAAAVVMDLAREKLNAAVGLACSTASGIKSFAAGTGGGMMKRMHAGRAAEAGVRMSQLAARGFTGPPTAVDGRFGLLEIFGGQGANPQYLVRELGKRYAVEEVFVKVYPVCSWIQSTVQQLVLLRGPQPLAPSEVKWIRVGVNAYVIKNNGQVAPPDTMGAQYSIPYCAALAVTGNPSDPAMYGPGSIDDPQRRELARRVELFVDSEMESAYPKHYGSRVELQLTNGDTRRSVVLDPHGMPADPCLDTERLDKFSRLASTVKSPDIVADIIQRVQGLEQVESIQKLTELLRN